MSLAGLLARPALRRRPAATAALLLFLGLFAVVHARPAAAAGPCDPPVQVIACENSLPGTPASDWDVAGAGDPNIQGFATSMSVAPGQTINFKIRTPASSYHIDILRLGDYQGNGARKVVANMAPTASLPQTQPNCAGDSAPTGLIDCGNWAVSASWAVPSTAVSGVYLAHLVRNDTGGESHIPFVVRDDTRNADLVFQTSDQTWQAYNTYGGNSLYTCASNCPVGTPTAYKGASKVSYNRPFHTAEDDLGRSWLLYSEYPMIRFLEANGYDVSYVSSIDVAATPSLLLNHKGFLSVGHDEYWTAAQRANVEAARDAGVHLAFFSANEVFWKTRLESSIAGPATANRTLVSFKDTHYDAQVDTQGPGTWTGTWMDPRFSPPGDGGNPQNALTGQLFVVNSGTTDINVPADYARLRFWRNTPVASLTGSQSRVLGAGLGTLGYEWDVDADNGFRPAGLMRMSSTTHSVPEAFVDYGGTVVPRTATHNLTIYRAASGALVFGSGTVQWPFGLDSGGTSRTPDPVMQQATVNLFADMGAQPQTLLSGLTAATASGDTTRPTSVVTAPAAGASLTDGSAVTVTGTATDSGGGVVAGVEISTDDGESWHPVTTMSPANGSVTWSYSWIAHGSPSTKIRTRAVDDSGNLESPSAGRTVNVPCPCTIWGSASAPVRADSGDTAGTEVGVKFTSDSYGYVTGIRFYKSSANTGTHVGHLWSASGQLLAGATFTGESASGWQSVTFGQPVALDKDTTYVASYYAPNGRFARDDYYFYPTPPMGPDPVITDVDSAPLHALRNTAGLVNGVFSRASAPGTFPTSSNVAANYWVDPVFVPQSFTASPGPVVNVNATAGFASANVAWTAPTTGDPVTTYTLTPYIGTTAQTPITVTGNPAPTTATVSGLTNGTAYTFTVTPSNPAGSGPESPPSNAVTPSTSIAHTVNGGFEDGLTAWITGGPVTPTSSVTTVHSGSRSALLGTVQPAQHPAGDSTLTQTVAVPATGQTSLSFWYWRASEDVTCSGNGCIWDWQEAQVRSTGGATLATIFKGNANTRSWQQVTFDLTPYAGTNVVLWFNVHQDAPSTPDNTWMYLDDVTLTQPAVPAAPTGVTAVAGSGSATLSWSAPTNTGGSAITSYTVTPYIGTTAQTPRTVTGSPPATTTTVTGLTNGTAYTFRVSATNATGTSAQSTASNAVTPSPLPGAPTGVTAEAANASATVSWSAPTNTGGSAITSYTVTPYIGATAQTPRTVTGSPPATTTTVTGLANGTAYSFRVSATNASGTGPESAASGAVTPTTVPGSPTAVTASAGDASATVSWTAPDPGGSAITSYTVTPYIGTTAQTPGTVTGANPVPTMTTVTGLANGTAYTFRVSATNASGPGPESAPSGAVTPAAAAAPSVSGVTPVSGATGVATSVAPTATFSEAVVPGSVSFTVTGAGGASVAGSVSFNGANTVATFTPSAALSAGVTYTATVSGAQNGSGVSMTGPFTWSFTTAAAVTCPCSVWGPGAPAGAVEASDASPANLGVQFRASTGGFVTGVRFYKTAGNTGSHVGSLWSSTGTLLATGTFGGESATGWQTLTFSSPVAVTAGTTYVASYHTGVGRYALTTSGLASAVTNGPLTALAGGGVYAYGSGNAFPSNSWNASNYWVDVVYTQTAPPSAPSVSGVTPVSGATGVATSVAPTATFSEAVVPGSVSFTVTGAGGASVAGSVSFNGANTVATFTPSAALSAGVTYTATVSGAQNGSGVSMTGPFTWSFTTAAAVTCPCSVWGPGAPAGAVEASDASPANLGVQFRASTGGFVTGVRFYKTAGNTGSHVGSLWSSTGTLLATGTFGGESATGWQTLTFSSPVAVTAGTTYVASYHTGVGRYALTTSGLASAVTNGPLTALAGGGVYAYGSGNAFPSNSWNASNYWVDVVYTQTAPPSAPSVSGVTPVSGATGVATSVAPTATFSEAVVPGSVSFTVTGAGGASVAGSVSFNGANTVATFTPSAALSAGVTYTATVSGAQNGSGVSMTGPFTWSFTTAAAVTCPCSVWGPGAPAGAVEASDASPANLGVQFRASTGGFVTGVRFYKTAGNTGSHVGSLWSSTGTLLATGTFGGESATGWQTLTFSSPVAVTAGTTYVASYHTGVGRYALTTSGLASAVTNGPLTALAGGGVYAYGSGNAFPSNSWNASNYWVDVVYTQTAP